MNEINITGHYTLRGSGGRTARGAVLMPEGRRLESPDRHAKITTAEVPLIEQGIEPPP